jgi:predicted nucleotidyltransferase
VVWLQGASSFGPAGIVDTMSRSRTSPDENIVSIRRLGYVDPAPSKEPLWDHPSPIIPNSGMIVPNMGRTAAGSMIADALLTPVQQSVLGLLFGQPDRRFRTAEIIETLASGTGAVHRQLQRLGAAGILTVTIEGNQKFYQANRSSPVFDELRGLMLKTVALREPLREALAPLAPRIDAAFVYGSIAKGTERASSDVDLLVISETLDYSDAYESLQQAEVTISRKINPTLMKPDEWKRKLSRSDGFVKRISEQPKLFIIGEEDAVS